LVEERLSNTIIAKEGCIRFFITLLLRNKKLLSTKERIETRIGIERFLFLFSNI